MNTKETKEFQAETKKLLDLMIHSIYINKEIFLRELISNASDALDKIRFESLTNVSILGDDSNLEIFIDIDENNKTISISDNGIGMNYEEVIENIGTIAKSGTKLFLEKMQEHQNNSPQDNMELIGQFGIGFYSAFMVAEKVTLLTKAPGELLGVKWESTGDGTYSIENIEREKRGTTVILTISEEFGKEDKPEENYLNRYTIQNMVKKYSDYIRYPIKMNFTKEEKPRDEEGKIIEDAVSEITIDTRTLNSMTPLWIRDKKDITPEEYQQFYKNLFHDWNEPLEVIHTKAEGMVEYTALLFIPSKAPYDFYSRDYQKGIRLYSRNVFVMDNCTELLPEYLRFVSGLVDSSDFSLNVSREILQHNKQLKLIGKNLEKSVLKILETMLTNDRKKYETFWAEFGKAIKGGIYMDYHNKEKLQSLLLFPSSKSNDDQITLDEYLKRMPEHQEVIYYVSGKDKASVERLPQMELLFDKGIEVLYLFDRVDEFAVDTLGEFNGKKFKSVSRGDLDLKDQEDEEIKKTQDELTTENKSLLETVKENLGSKVTDVRLSNRLKSSAVCLVSSDSGISMSMEQILSEANQSMFKASRILELNPKHEVFAALKEQYDIDPKSANFKDYCELLFAQALLVEGFTLDNPVEFANQISKLMVAAANK